MLRLASRRASRGRASPSGSEPYPPEELAATEPYGRRAPGRGRRSRRRLGPLPRRRTVRVILAVVAVSCCWLAFSVGQAPVPMRLSIAYLTLLFAAVAVTALLPWGRWGRWQDRR